MRELLKGQRVHINDPLGGYHQMTGVVDHSSADRRWVYVDVSAVRGQKHLVMFARDELEPIEDPLF